VDDAGAAVEPGVVGELVLRSRFIALGSWDGGRCVPGNIRWEAGDPPVRVLRTGDLAHIDSDGLCTIVGRKDRQVKVHGMRVEPAEIEAALRDLPDILDAAVITRRTDKTVTLTAFIVPRQATSTVVPRVRAALRSRLPTAMRPSRIRVVPSIPLLPSGKLDVRALEALDRDRDTDATDSAAPTTVANDVRQAVQRAWRAVLGRRALAEAQSFEDAGGDSLKLLQLVLWLETLRGRRLPLDLFTGDMQPEDLIRILEEFEQRRTADPAIDRRPTVFLFPGLDGDEPRLANFRAMLEDRLRFVIVDYPDWPEMVRRGQGFAALVDHAVSQITAAQPAGALLLAGYSYGGDVAFAATARLIGLQRHVGFLGILDTDLRRVVDAAALRRNLGFIPHFRQVLSDVPHDRISIGIGFVFAKCARELFGLERMLRYRRVWHPLLSARIGFAFHRRIRTILRLRAQWQWHHDAVPASIAVPTALFRSGAADASADMGWRERCPNLSVLPVGGDHRSMLDVPHRAALCSSFAEAVEGLLNMHDKTSPLTTATLTGVDAPVGAWSVHPQYGGNASP
jgi:thioesterase domain-containing protein